MTSAGGVARDRLAILFCVMLVAAAGNTAMQSTLPAIASRLGVADAWVSIAFSWSALLWVICAPRWARLSDRRGRRVMMAVGLTGFIASMGLCGLALWLGLAGVIGATSTFVLFALFRTLYGGFGSASPPAVQAYVAARTEGEERTSALSLLASSFGLGTVIGPAIAHFLVFAPLDLAGPLFVFAAVAALVLLALRLRLPSDSPRFAARGAVAGYPGADASNSASLPHQGRSEGEGGEVRLSWTDRRIAHWLLMGLAGGHAQAILLGVVGFVVRDRLGLAATPDQAVRAIGTVMFVGALATLLAQWGLIPLLKPSPRSSALWGAALAVLGVIATGLAGERDTLALGYALASLGFGLFRPGFTAGASLALGEAEQGDVAGKITSVNGMAYIVAPAIGVAMYDWREWTVFALIAVTLLVALAAALAQPRAEQEAKA